MDLKEVLLTIRPNDEWCLEDNNYDELVWLSETEPPTFDECQTAWNHVELEVSIRSIREKRNKLLLESDWTQISDVNANKLAWETYRQELRDLPTNIRDVGDVVWPTPPQ